MAFKIPKGPILNFQYQSLKLFWQVHHRPLKSCFWVLNATKCCWSTKIFLLWASEWRVQSLLSIFVGDKIQRKWEYTVFLIIQYTHWVNPMLCKCKSLEELWALGKFLVISSQEINILWIFSWKAPVVPLKGPEIAATQSYFSTPFRGH